MSEKSTRLAKNQFFVLQTRRKSFSNILDECSFKNLMKTFVANRVSKIPSVSNVDLPQADEDL